MLLPFPTDLPSEILQVVIDALHGFYPSPAHANHCLWHVYGYGSGKFAADNNAAISGHCATSEHCNNLALLVGSDNGQILWSKLLPLLLQLLVKILPSISTNK